MPDNAQWVKPLSPEDIPEGHMPLWDAANQVWTFVPREVWNVPVTIPPTT